MSSQTCPRCLCDPCPETDDCSPACIPTFYASELEASVANLRSENERLRGALEEIARSATNVVTKIFANAALAGKTMTRTTNHD